MDYRGFLKDRVLEVQDMIAECENLGFHHAPIGTREEIHYANMIGLEVKLNAQIKKFPTLVPLRKASDRLDGGSD